MYDVTIKYDPGLFVVFLPRNYDSKLGKIWLYPTFRNRY